MVNGPEDLLRLDAERWETIDWRVQEEQVRRLRCRIFKAVQDLNRPSRLA
ncbi:reverse transcriptase N-terminal domain-containing protein [Micrococcus luteus]